MLEHNVGASETDLDADETNLLTFFNFSFLHYGILNTNKICNPEKLW